MTGVYKINLIRNGNLIFVQKRININNEVGQALTERLKRKKHRLFFKKCITETSKNALLGKHAVHGQLINGRGNYMSPLVKGPTLGNIERIETLDCHSCVALISACETLIGVLRRFHRQNGYLLGDWTLHNLVWNVDSGELVNIDLEGFLYL